MKKPLVLVIALLMIGTTNVLCQNSNELQGAWEITYLEYVYTALNDTLYETEFVNPSVKLITKKHFAFGHLNYDGKSFSAGGGEYSYDGRTYTEHIKYHSHGPAVGTSVEFKSKLEGDTWTISGALQGDEGEILLKEIWKRIE